MAVHDVQMRVPGATKTASETLKTYLELQEDFMRKLFDTLPAPPYDSVKSVSVELHDDCCHVHEKAAFPPRKITEIEREFRRLVGDTEATRILDDAELWADLAAGTNAEIPSNPMSMGILDAIRKAVNQAWEKANTAWNRLTGAKKASTPLNLSKIPTSAVEPWIAELNRAGYTLIRDKITLEFLPEIMQTINTALSQKPLPLSWAEIAVKLKRDMGGKTFHWSRLVRTEFAGAIQRAQIRQYGSMGATGWKWSTSRFNACDICAPRDGHVYPINAVPLIPQTTHPNCRCTGNPVF